jgi:hypothetical protein
MSQLDTFADTPRRDSVAHLGSNTYKAPFSKQLAIATPT